MPRARGEKVGTGALRPGPALIFMLALGGCMGTDGPGVSKFGFGAGMRPDQVPGPQLQQAGAERRSAIVDDLVSRRSMLPTSGPYAEVARAVTEANAGVARAELRVARLKAEAKAKNWLPKIGPRVSLTDLGAVAASMLIEQAIFDGGARKAERAWAAADVEVAAATLSADANTRVLEGLSHYIRAQRAREQAVLSQQAVARMAEYERIITIRADGGMADRSEQGVIQQKTLELRSQLSTDRFTAEQAMAELNAMASRPLDGLSGLQPLPRDPGAPEPVSVVKTRAEATRSLAEADMARAGYTPGLSATATIDKDDGLTSGLTLGLQNSLGLGTGAEIAAINMTGDVVDRRIARSAEEANRRIVALQHEIATLEARQAEGAMVLAETEATLHMFTEQFKVGRRPLMELVGMSETYSGLARNQAGLKYEIALKRLEIARDRGVLVNGTEL